MIAIGLLLVRMLCDCFKPRSRLEAEILIAAECQSFLDNVIAVSTAFGHGMIDADQRRAVDPWAARSEGATARDLTCGARRTLSLHAVRDAGGRFSINGLITRDAATQDFNHLGHAQHSDSTALELGRCRISPSAAPGRASRRRSDRPCVRARRRPPGPPEYESRRKRERHQSDRRWP